MNFARSITLGAVFFATSIAAETSVSASDSIERRADALYDFVLGNGRRIGAEDVANKLIPAGFDAAEIPNLIDVLITNRRARQSDGYLMVIYLC
ncbi:MAG: hypothetical protein AAF625_17425 [Pseudomonadota bacterium]